MSGTRERVLEERAAEILVDLLLARVHRAVRRLEHAVRALDGAVVRPVRGKERERFGGHQWEAFTGERFTLIRVTNTVVSSKDTIKLFHWCNDSKTIPKISLPRKTKNFLPVRIIEGELNLLLILLFI